MKIKLPIYRFNKNNLEYNNIILSKKLFLKLVIIQVIISFSLVYMLSLFHNTPKEKRLIYELNELKHKFYLIDKKTDEIQYLLDVLEQKDSVIYQALFSTTINKNKFETGYISEQDGYFNDTVLNIGNKLSKLAMQLELINLKFKKVIIEISKNDARLSHMPAIQPISNSDLKRTSSGFGMRMHPIYKINKMHYGMDFVAPIGTPIFATADGEISIASNSYFGYGKYIKIRHSDEYQTAYGHMNEIKVKKGDKIKRGDIIGTIGSTGLSTGPHLHYEVIYKNQPVDPINYYFHDLTPDQYDEMIRISSSIEKSLD